MLFDIVITLKIHFNIKSVIAVKLERLTKHTAVAVCLNEYMDEDGPENIK